MTLKSVDTLLDVYSSPDSHTAIVVPELGINVTYRNRCANRFWPWRTPLASAGIRRGDAVAIALPNGLPAIVSFSSLLLSLDCSPLNPAYPYEEFHFFLGDTQCPYFAVSPVGAEFVRTAAADRKIPVFSWRMNEQGNVRMVGAPSGATRTEPTADDIALVLTRAEGIGRPKRRAFAAFLIWAVFLG